MTRKELRGRDLYYRQNPDQIFASVANLAEACCLILAGAKKLDDYVADEVGNLWNDRAGLTFLEMVRHELGSHKVRGLDVSELMRRVARHLGNWAAKSPACARKFFGHIAGAMTTVVPQHDGDFCITSTAALWFSMQHNRNLLNELSTPSPPTNPLRMLYVGAAAGNEESLATLMILWQVMEVHHCNPMPWATRAVYPAECYWFPVLGAEEFMLWAKGNKVRLCQESGIDDIVRKASRKMPQILSLIEALWEDILLNSRCGIRGNREDAFFLTGPWDNIGQAHRYFYTGDLKFPEVGICTTLPYGDRHVWAMIEFTPRAKEECLAHGPFGALSYLGNLIAYREVVCHAPAKQQSKPLTPRPITDVTPQVVMTSVRDYERTLPVNQQCNPERAKAFRQKFGRELTEGKTYVSDHVRSVVPGNRLIEALPGQHRPRFSIDLEAIIEKL